MSQKLTRRDFLKMSAAAAAASVVSGCTANLQRTEYLESYVRPPEEGLPGENLWYASTCRQCSAGCGIIVRVSEGRARKIEGNPLHPVNRGKLCARGQAALQELYDPDRLRNTVWQTGGRGSQQVVVRRFLEALGDELDGRQALTLASQQLFGAPSLPIFDIANADVVFSFGANFLETWLSPVSYSRAYAQMRHRPLGKRGYMVQFEPRLSSTAASADQWVAVRPGTEGLVALALGKIILDQGPGRDAQQAALYDYDKVDVAQVAEASGVSAEELERLARIFASVPSQVAIPGGVLAAQRNGTAALTTVQALNLILARMGQPGGVFLPAETAVEGFTPPPLSTFADVQALIERMAAGQVQLLFIHGTNPLFELPTATGFARALAQVPFVVSCRIPPLPAPLSLHLPVRRTRSQQVMAAGNAGPHDHRRLADLDRG